MYPACCASNLVGGQANLPACLLQLRDSRRRTCCQAPCEACTGWPLCVRAHADCAQGSESTPGSSCSCWGLSLTRSSHSQPCWAQTPVSLPLGDVVAGARGHEMVPSSAGDGGSCAGSRSRCVLSNVCVRPEHAPRCSHRSTGLDAQDVHRWQGTTRRWCSAQRKMQSSCAGSWPCCARRCLPGASSGLP